MSNIPAPTPETDKNSPIKILVPDFGEIVLPVVHADKCRAIERERDALRLTEVKGWTVKAESFKRLSEKAEALCLLVETLGGLPYELQTEIHEAVRQVREASKGVLHRQPLELVKVFPPAHEI